MRPIDADKLKELRHQYIQGRIKFDDSEYDLIDKCPTIDAVPVVRCKDCWKRYDIDECPMCVLHITSYFEYTADDGFCDRGELRPHHDSLCDQTEEGEA